MKKSEIKIGTPVIYWGIIEDNGERFYPLKTTISSEPWELGHGDVVCKVEGKSGGVSISHLDPITPGSLIAAKLRGATDLTENDIIMATENWNIHYEE